MKIKTIMLFIITVLFSIAASLANAEESNFEYTGNVAQLLESTWFGAQSSTIGGPTGNDIFGSAQQFIITQPTDISTLTSTANVSASNYGSTTFTYNVYSGTTNQNSKPVPDYHTLLTTSDPITITETQQQSLNGENQTVTQQANFKDRTILQPGTYWISEEGRGGAIVTTSQTYGSPTALAYVSPSDPSSNTAQTPEPSVLVFFILLIGFILWRENALGRLV